MTATSHAIIGATIGFVVDKPVLALPLALVSHFAADALPHVGLDEFGGHLKQQVLFRRMLIADASLLTVFLLFLLIQQVSWVIFACVFLAGAPDFVWAYRYVFQEKGGKVKPRNKNRFSQFHSRIQWSQTLHGMYLEVPVALLLLALISLHL